MLLQILAILGVKALWEYDWHVCIWCSMHAWRPLHPSEWQAAYAEHVAAVAVAAEAATRGDVDAPGLGAVNEDSRCTCPRCHGARFKCDKHPGTGVSQVAPYTVRICIACS
jgi:hypothetical protein